jgi:hypothetical protein
MKSKLLVTIIGACYVLACQLAQAQPKSGDIIHDAEHYVLLDQHAERWAEEDKRNTRRLEELRQKNGASHPISSIS